MSELWFRAYTEALDDPKIQTLPLPLFKAWFNLLCLTKINDGTLPDIEKIAYRLRVTKAKAELYFSALVAAGLFDETDGAFRPHNWDGRQFASDVSTERVKRFRNGQRNVSETVTKTEIGVSETANAPFHGKREIEREKEKESIKEKEKEKDREKTESETESEPETFPQPRKPDGAYESFAAAFYELNSPARYVKTKGDFVQLAALRREHGTDARDMPPGWLQACRNYHSSPLGKPSMADMCTRYGVFVRGGVDRFGVPVGGKSDERENDNVRAAQDFVSRKLAETVCSDLSDVREEALRLSRTVR